MSKSLRTARAAGLALAVALTTWNCAAQSPAMSASSASGPAQRSLDETVLIARRMAAAATGLPPAGFEVVAAMAVTWADGAMGCAEPGRLYTQALVPGYLVRLRAPDGGLLNFHASRRGAVVHCPEGRAQPPAATEVDR